MSPRARALLAGRNKMRLRVAPRRAAHSAPGGELQARALQAGREGWTELPEKQLLVTWTCSAGEPCLGSFLHICQDPLTCHGRCLKPRSNTLAAVACINGILPKAI